MMEALIGSFWKHKLPRWLGYGFFVGMMAVGYYYNLTFVQLGLLDWGRRGVGLPRSQVAAYMALLAVLTCLFSLGFGWLMRVRGWGKDFRLKLRIAFGVVALQLILTVLAMGIQSQYGYLGWLVGASCALGVGVPVTFGMTVDLIPRGGRGYAAALVTGLAYLGANILPVSWTLKDFARPVLWIMPPGLVFLGMMAFFPLPWVERLAEQHTCTRFGIGRYAREADHRLYLLILLMFGVFFTDSLGFLRMVETPRFMESAWQASSLNIRAFIGAVHLGAALIGGVLYRALDVRELFYWIFGIFALTHLLYTFSLRIGSDNIVLTMPILYAVAVSLYTVVNFALWADLSTPESIGFNAALGVSLSGWTATFVSTGLAIWMEDVGVSLERHLNITDAIAMLFFLGLIILPLLPGNQERSERE